MEKLISKKQVKEMLSISATQIDRWETEEKYAHMGVPILACNVE